MLFISRNTVLAFVLACTLLFLFGFTYQPFEPEAPQYSPDLAERNRTWERLCTATDCNTLPMNFFTIALSPGIYDTPSARSVRLYMPLDDSGRPIEPGWGMPRTAAEYDPSGRALRQYYAGRNFEIICCAEELSDKLGLNADSADLMINYVNWFGATQHQNLLGAHLYGRISSATDLVIDPSDPPMEFFEDYTDHFWRVTHRYQLSGDRIDGFHEFLSKQPLVAGRHLYAQCNGSTCTIYTLQNQDDRMDMPHIQFSVGGGVETLETGCKTRALGGECVTVDGILRDMADTAAFVRSLNASLLSPN